MKILHIINSLSIGGAEKLIIETLPLLQKEKGLEVDLALFNSEESPFYIQLKKENPSVKIYEFSKGSVYNPLNIFRIIPLLRKYDVIHAHLFPVMYFVVLAKILTFSKVKLIFTEHSTGNRRMQNPKFKRIEQFIYKHYSKIICITEGVKKELQRCLSIPSNKLKVIHNGINISKIKNETKLNREEFGFSSEDKLLIMVAGFRIQKDQDTLIKCLQILPSQYKLILVGDGERRNVLEKLVTELNLSDRVTFLGIRNNVVSLIKMSDIAVLSSHWEGFGLAAAEAMVCGVPTIASNVNGLNAVVSKGGLLFEKGDVQDLKNKIQLLEDESFYNKISNRCIEKAYKYDIQEMIKKLIDIYEEV
ncbi:glycosyl transferase [Capnocytophaga canimorsus]|uniref:glycosyltransferase n=1 Tax=Capnocytophaga canimorsus TaxID=28188 RepID=UPI001AC19B7B|nr:glycosyltransferase [Capnocytophaga canimorsus]GIM56335.1 glycosyl transferase [Capnocytophaga canimorsus]